MEELEIKEPQEIKPKGKRGFASMSVEKRRQIASLGGKKAHATGTAHRFTPNEAREAGRKGGLTVSKDRARMKELGRLGGLARNSKKHEKSGS